MNKIYLEDSYKKSQETFLQSVTQIGGGTALLCEDLLFHPEGGGQPDDYGELNVLGGVYKVKDLIRDKGEIHIVLDAQAISYEELNNGDDVTCHLDWDRRYKLMKLHTAGHVLMASARELLKNYEAKGIQIQEDANGAIVKFLANEQLTDRALVEIDSIVQDAIRRNLTVTAQSYRNTQEAQDALGSLFRIDPKLTLKGKVRIIVIDGFDANPCGGTHIKALGELGKIDLGGITQQGDSGEFRLQYSLSSL